MSELSELYTRFSAFRKSAFQPWQGQQGGGAPPAVDPATGQPIDPAMAAQGGAPPPGMDPAMAGGAPPPGVDPATGQPMPPQGGSGIPPELEKMLSDLAGGIQSLTGIVQGLQQNQEMSSQQSQALQQELAQIKSTMTQPAPMEGMM